MSASPARQPSSEDDASLDGSATIHQMPGARQSADHATQTAGATTLVRRAGGEFHPAAIEACDRHVATFRERLEAEAVAAAGRENSETVGLRHIDHATGRVRAAPKWRAWVFAGGIWFAGVPAGKAIELGFDIWRLNGTPPDGTWMLLVACVAMTCAGLAIAAWAKR